MTMSTKVATRNSTTLLKTLDVMKAEEFGNRQITLKEVPQLHNAEKKSSPSTSIRRSKRTRSASQDPSSELQTPKRPKLNGKLKSDIKVPETGSGSPSNPPEVTSNVETNSELKTDVSSISDAHRFIKKSKNAEVDRESERAKQMKFLDSFVQISLKYSEYLENKVGTSQQR